MWSNTMMMMVMKMNSDITVVGDSTTSKMSLRLSPFSLRVGQGPKTSRQTVKKLTKKSLLYLHKLKLQPPPSPKTNKSGPTWKKYSWTQKAKLTIVSSDTHIWASAPDCEANDGADDIVNDLIWSSTTISSWLSCDKLRIWLPPCRQSVMVDQYTVCGNEAMEAGRKGDLKIPFHQHQSSEVYSSSSLTIVVNSSVLIEGVTSSQLYGCLTAGLWC